MNSQHTTPTQLINEKQIIATELSLISKDDIALIDSGWDSRVYYVHSLHIIYKFPRSDKIRKNYAHEIELMQKISGIESGILVPEVISIEKNHNYFSYAAIHGRHLSDVANKLSNTKKRDIGHKLGSFLKILHSTTIESFPRKNIDDEIDQLYKWSEKALEYISQRVDKDTYNRVVNYVEYELPNSMSELSETIGLCHGDFHASNILVHNNAIGIIDFGDSAYMDTSKDFVGITDESILQAMYEAYSVDEMFKKKIYVRKRAFDFIKLTANIGKNDWSGAELAKNRILESVDNHKLQTI